MNRGASSSYVVSRFPKAVLAISVATALLAANRAGAEDGYRLWLRYDRLPDLAVEQYRAHLTPLLSLEVQPLWPRCVGS